MVITKNQLPVIYANEVFLLHNPEDNYSEKT